MPNHEHRHRLAFPSYRVYVFGVDVTEDVLSVSITNNEGNAPNSCQITLVNDFDKYILTTKDIQALNLLKGLKFTIPWIDGKRADFGSEQVSAMASASEVKRVSNSNNLTSGDLISIADEEVDIHIKRTILKRKFAQIEPDAEINPVGIIEGSRKFNDYFGAKVLRYPLADGAPILHPMDPLRVFMRDPFDPKRWYHMFAGFISDMTENTDENNQKTFTVLAEDSTKLFRYTRVAINPGIGDAKKVVQDEDLALHSFYKNALQEYTLPELFFTMLFGPDKIGSDKAQTVVHGPNGPSKIQTKLRAIGHFSFDTSAIFEFGPPPPPTNPLEGSVDEAKYKKPKEVEKEVELKTSLFTEKEPIRIEDLAHYQAIIDHEVKVSDIWMMATEEDRSNKQIILNRLSTLAQTGRNADGNINVENVMDEIGKNPDRYLIDGGRLMMLLPKSLGIDNTKIIAKDIISGYNFNTEFINVGEILYNTVERIQFSMYASPRGDIVVEPPLYDFDPDDFGLESVDHLFIDNMYPTYTYTQVQTTVSSDLGPVAPSTVTNVKLISLDKLVRQYRTAANVADGQGVLLITSGESNDLGPFGQTYVIRRHDTYGWDSAYTDSKVYTAAAVSRALIQNWESIGYTQQVTGQVEFVRLDSLIPIYGVRAAPITNRSYISTEKGAIYYAHLTLNRLNADARSMSIRHLPNIKLWLNRPTYVEGRNLLATPKQISHNVVWNSDMSTNTTLYAVRTWEGLMRRDEPEVPIYTPIGGYASSPLNYAVLFETAPKPADDEEIEEKKQEEEKKPEKVPWVPFPDLDPSELAPIGNGKFLRKDAAAAFNAMADAYKTDTGFTLAVNDGYRSNARQKTLYDRYQSDKTKYPVAAAPGRSLHNKGHAVDIGGIGLGFSGPIFNWLTQNAGIYGFDNVTGRLPDVNEPWHWEYKARK